MNEHMRNEIVRRWYAGSSLRNIAEQLRCSRNTIRRVIRGHARAREEGHAHPDLDPVQHRPSKIDSFKDTVIDLLTRYPNITAVRMHEELTARGFTGGYGIVKERLRELRPRPTRSPVVRFETAPGFQAQMDYSVYTLDFTHEGRRRVHLFSYLLGYSRRQYLRFVEREDFQTTVQQHIHAFNHLGGVATTCLYDNFKVVVTGYDGDEPIYNTRFLAFATHYGYRPKACRIRRPQSKGKVERPFDFVENNLFNARTFRSLDHLNEVTAWWLSNTADVRIHRETRRRPIDMHSEELPRLLPLPSMPYDTAIVVYRSVGAEGFVAYDGNLYSVPWNYIGRDLPVRITEDEVIVYDPIIKEIARHARFSRADKGQRCEDPAHRPKKHSPARLEWLHERFTELGPAATRFLEGLLAAQRAGKSQARKILALGGTYRRQDLIAALEHAVRFGAFSLCSVERILAVQAQPKSPLETLFEQHGRELSSQLAGPPVLPRSTAEYQQLLLPEYPDDGEANEQAQKE